MNADAQQFMSDPTISHQLQHHPPPPSHQQPQSHQVTNPLTASHNTTALTPQAFQQQGGLTMQQSDVQRQTERSRDVREQDRLLPIANISRIMKRALPSNAKMSKESKSCIQECVSEFIGFITSEASDRLVEDKRKTITGDDVIDSMRALGFDAYMGFLQVFLQKYREAVKGGKATTTKRGRKKNVPDESDDKSPKRRKNNPT